MFDLAEKRIAWIPIVWKGVRQPADPDALAEPCDFEIQVLAEIVSRERLQEIFEGADEEDDTDEVKARRAKARELSEIDRFKTLVSNWRNLRLGGQPAEFNDQNIQALLGFPNFAWGFTTSYLKAWGGQIELAQKNSADSSGSGQPGEESKSAKTKTRSGRKPRS